MNASIHAGPSRPRAAEGEVDYLGVEYRDFITQLDLGKNALTAREERAAKLQAKQEAEERRLARERGAADGDAHAEMSMKWHSLSDKADPRAALSADIQGGQAHRVRQREAIACGLIRDIEEPTHGGRAYGEERTQFLQSRNARGNYITANGPEHDADRAHRSVSATTPRSHRGLQSAPIPTNSSAGQAVPARPDGHVRAPSPRASGTVRFGAGGRRTEIPPSRASTAAHESAAPRPSLGASSTAPRAAASSSAARVTNSVPASSNRNNVATSSFYTNIGEKKPTSSNPSYSQPATSQSRADKNTLYQPEDYVPRQQLQYKALWHAASPDSLSCKDFLKSHPEAGMYLREARRRLVNEISAIIKDEDMKEMERYIQTHREREKMVGFAMKAKEMVVYATEAEAHGYYANNQDQEDFFEAAKAVYSPQAVTEAGAAPSASSTAPTMVPTPSQAPQAPVQAPASKAATATAASSASGGFKPILPLTDPTAPAPAQTAYASITGKQSRIKAASSTNDTVQTVPQVAQSGAQARPSTSGTTSLPPHLRQTNGHARPLTNGTTASSSTAPAHTPAAPHVNGTTPSSSAAPSRTPAVPHANGTTRKAPASISAASSGESLRSAATDITVPPQMRGVTNINFFDHTGNFLQQQQVKIEAPMNVTVMLNSTSSTCDPRKYFEALKQFAESKLVELSRVPGEASASDGTRGLQGAFGFAGGRGLDGAAQDDDGIWIEKDGGNSESTGEL